MVGEGARMRVLLAVFWLAALLAAPVAHAATFAGPFASYPDTVVGDGPEAYWREGETAGTSAADATGDGHTGTLAAPADHRKRAGALPGDADGALADGV